MPIYISNKISNNSITFWSTIVDISKWFKFSCFLHQYLCLLLLQPLVIISPIPLSCIFTLFNIVHDCVIWSASATPIGCLLGGLRLCYYLAAPFSWQRGLDFLVIGSLVVF